MSENLSKFVKDLDLPLPFQSWGGCCRGLLFLRLVIMFDVKYFRIGLFYTVSNYISEKDFPCWIQKSIAQERETKTDCYNNYWKLTKMNKNVSNIAFL